VNLVGATGRCGNQREENSWWSANAPIEFGWQTIVCDYIPVYTMGQPILPENEKVSKIFNEIRYLTGYQ